jgi:hypothetical protein
VGTEVTASSHLSPVLQRITVAAAAAAVACLFRQPVSAVLVAAVMEAQKLLRGRLQAVQPTLAVAAVARANPVALGRPVALE